MKKAQSNNDHIGEALLLLMGFSVALGAEIKSIGVNINNISSVNNIFSDNIHLLMIPALVYLFIKQKNIFLKCIYLLSTLPFIYWSSMIQSLNIKTLFYINLIIIFIVIISLIKYIYRTFEKTKTV
jgi:hypothetical protein